NGGVVFLPSGRYRLTRTIYVWRAVRVFGYGGTRPGLVPGPSTPSDRKGVGLSVVFSSAARPGPPPGNARVPFPPPGQVPPRDDVPDASQVTFYSAMSNVDVETGGGTPAAAAVPFHVARAG